MTPKRPLLTVIIHTKNEESNIVACIKSCQTIADEILVVDMKSTDATVALAKKLGAKILSVPDVGYVEPARKLALQKAQSEWILILDADERLRAPLRKKILRLIAMPPSNCIAIPSKNIFFGYWLQHGLRWPDTHIRLFAKGSVEWPGEIHSQPIIHDEVYQLPGKDENAILHFHTTSLNQIAQKALQQARSENYYASQDKITAKMIHQRIHNEVISRITDHNGLEDGIPGYIAAKFMEYYRFLEFVAYWEQHRELTFSEKELQEFAPPASIWTSFKRSIKKYTKKVAFKLLASSQSVTRS